MSTVSTTTPVPDVVIATSGGLTFPAHRVTDPTDECTSWQLQFDGYGDVEVARSGFAGDGPWGVDLYRPSSVALPVEEARKWAHAILAAADLADKFEHAAHEVPC